MYFVDRNKLEEQLKHLEQLQLFLGERSKTPTSQVERLAFERAIHISIEAILDIGNHMIDGFIMRDPGSYEDIIEILRDEKVIYDPEAKALVAFVLLRKEIVNQYTQLKVEHVWNVYKQSQEALHNFPVRIRDYLQDQLGPVSAFRPSSS